MHSSRSKLFHSYYKKKILKEDPALIAVLKEGIESLCYADRDLPARYRKNIPLEHYKQALIIFKDTPFWANKDIAKKAIAKADERQGNISSAAAAYVSLNHDQQNRYARLEPVLGNSSANEWNRHGEQFIVEGEAINLAIEKINVAQSIKYELAVLYEDVMNEKGKEIETARVDVKKIENEAKKHSLQENSIKTKSKMFTDETVAKTEKETKLAIDIAQKAKQCEKNEKLHEHSKYELQKNLQILTIEASSNHQALKDAESLQSAISSSVDGLQKEYKKIQKKLRYSHQHLKKMKQERAMKRLSSYNISYVPQYKKDQFDYHKKSQYLKKVKKQQMEIANKLAKGKQHLSDATRKKEALQISATNLSSQLQSTQQKLQIQNTLCQIAKQEWQQTKTAAQSAALTLTRSSTDAVDTLLRFSAERQCAKSNSEKSNMLFTQAKQRAEKDEKEFKAIEQKARQHFEELPDTLSKLDAEKSALHQKASETFEAAKHCSELALLGKNNHRYIHKTETTYRDASLRAKYHSKPTQASTSMLSLSYFQHVQPKLNDNQAVDTERSRKTAHGIAAKHSRSISLAVTPKELKSIKPKPFSF